MPENTDHLAEAKLTPVERIPDAGEQMGTDAEAARQARERAVAGVAELKAELEAAEALKPAGPVEVDATVEHPAGARIAAGMQDPDDDPVGELEVGGQPPEAGDALGAALDHGATNAVAKRRALLELNGFHSIRTEVLNHVAALERIPLEAIEAALDYSRKATHALEVDPGDNTAALKAANRELLALDAARRFRRDLGTLEERIIARERLTAR